MSSQRLAAAQAEAIRVSIDLSGRWLAVSGVIAALLAALSPHNAMVYSYVVGIAVLATISILASLRFYNEWFSWTAWLIPLAPLWFALDSVQKGAVSIVTPMFVYALAFAIMFGIFYVARERLHKWLTTGAF